MSNTNLGTATITFKGDFDAFERDIQRANAKVDQFNKMMASPAGQQRLEMAAMAARKLNAEMANMSRLNLISNEKVWQKQKLAQERQQERDENWLAKREAKDAQRIQKEKAAAEARQRRDEDWLARREAKDARIMARQERDEAKKDARIMARQERDEAKKAQRGRMQLAAGGVGLGAAAIGAASVASPLAADTLQGSMKLLTATIGREFVPMVMQLSYALQDAAKWWRELDPAVRGATAETVKMVGAAGAAAVGVAGLVKILSMLGPVGIAAGVGVFAGEMMNKKVNDRQDKLAAGVHGLANNPDLVEAEKLAAKDGRTEFFKNRKDGIELARLDLLRAVNTRNEAVGKSNDYQKGLFGGGGFVAGAQRVWDGFGGDKGDSLLKDVEKASIDQAKAQARLNAVLKANGQDPAAPNRHLLDMVGGAAQAGLQGGKDGGHALGSMGPSSYSSLQDFYRTFNVNATSGSSLEAQTLQIQTEMRDGILKMNQTLDQKLGKAN